MGFSDRYAQACDGRRGGKIVHDLPAQAHMGTLHCVLTHFSRARTRMGAKNTRFLKVTGKIFA